MADVADVAGQGRTDGARLPRWGRWAAGALAGLVALAVARWAGSGGSMAQGWAWIQSLGPWAPVGFMVAYAVACVFWVPASWLTLGGGAVFGWFWGTVYVFVGALAGAIASFLVSRFLVREWVARRLAQHPRVAALDQALEREGWRLVLLTRLSPGFPFNLLNYAYGLTRVRFRDYVSASALGMLPGTMLYVYLGSLVGDLARLRETRTRSTGEWVLLVAGLVATLALTVHVTRLARRALANRLPGTPTGTVASLPPRPLP